MNDNKHNIANANRNVKNIIEKTGVPALDILFSNEKKINYTSLMTLYCTKKIQNVI